MDFMLDNLRERRSFRCLNVLDDFNREALRIEVNFSLPSERVIRALEQVIEWRGSPEAIRVGTGPEHASAPMRDWASSRGIAPTSSSRAARGGTRDRAFDGTCRWEWFDQHAFPSIQEAQETSTAWMSDCNEIRPHQGLCGLSPSRKLAASGWRYRRGGGLVFAGDGGAVSRSVFSPFGVFRVVGRSLAA